MQLVRRGDPRAFEVIYERHSGAAFSLAYRMVGTRRRRRGRRAGGLPLDLALRRALRARPRLGPHVGARDRPPPGDRRAAPLLGARQAPRAATRGSRSAWRRGERTDDEAARREEAATRALGAWSTLPADQCQVIELAYFGGFTHTEIAEHARDAGRHREGPDAARAREDAQRARARWRCRRHDRACTRSRAAGPTRSAPTLLGALPDDEAAGFERAPRRVRRPAARTSTSLQVAADALPASAAPHAPAARR